MIPPGRSGKPPRGGLSDEDAALWELASQAYEPLRQRMKRRVHPVQSEADHSGSMVRYKPDAPSHAHNSAARHAAGHAAAHTPLQRPAPEPVIPSRAPPMAEFDRKKAKKLAAGRLAIEARIDLHGMRQSEAHSSLRSFLLSCYERGRRHVLIITGKGGPVRGEQDQARDFMDTRERGVLRRNVPHWLAEPELRAIVVSYREAAQPHGGGGALYVHLRARHRSGE